MSSHKCVRCGHWWAFNSGLHGEFQAITRFCPLCIPVVFPVMGLSALPKAAK